MLKVKIHFNFKHLILKLHYLALKWDTLEQILLVTFDYIDKNVRLIQLAHSGENYLKLEKRILLLTYYFQKILKGKNLYQKSLPP